MPKMKLKTNANMDANVNTMKVPPGSEASIFFSMITSEQVYPKTNMGMIFMSSFTDILPRTAAKATTEARPHLAALLSAVISIVILMCLSKPVMMRSQKECIRMWSCQLMRRERSANIIGVN